jgi:hypothetical protein
MAFVRRHGFSLVFGLCLAASLSPLWVARHLPAVDAPQHLYLIHVLGHLDDPSLPYGGLYVERPGLTYLTFYYTVRTLASALGEEAALRVWLTLVLAGIPLSLLALLKALRRSPWLALLACPLVYTDSFYWGLVSFQSSLPLTILSMAFLIRALELPAGTRSSILALTGLAVSLLLLQLTHAAGMIFPATALPLLLITTPSDGRRRLRALAALAPGAALFCVWLFSGVAKGRELGAPGEPWKAAAPLLNRANFVFDPIQGKVARLVELLSNGFWSYADRPAIWGLLAVAALAAALAVVGRRPSGGPLLTRLRPALLAALALGYYLALPFDVNGYMYYIYPRYAQLVALLAIPAIGFPAVSSETGALFKVWAVSATSLALYAGLNLAVQFHRFDVEAENFEMVARQIPPHAKIMHLVTDWGSRWASHAVYLHYAALAALRVNGVPSFSLATDPSFPVGYRQGARPPASRSEWRPLAGIGWEQAQWYDCFLTRGENALDSLLGAHAREVHLVSRAERWRLYCKQP